MPRRSLLFSPGDRRELLFKAARTDADVLCFDLEDGVAPDRKSDARETVSEVLSDPEFDPDAEVCVRLSGVDATADLDALLRAGPGRPDAVMVPKVDAADRLTAVADACTDCGFEPAVFAMIETAAGVQAAPAIAAADPTDVLVFGAEDFAADVGATRTAEGTEVLYARERVVIAAAAADDDGPDGDVEAIDTLHTRFDDLDGLREEAAFAAELGFDGKIAIHPDQVGPINEAFTPDADRIEWARAVLDARDREPDRGVFQVDGEMIDAPLVAQAEQIRRRAIAADRW